MKKIFIFLLLLYCMFLTEKSWAADVTQSAITLCGMQQLTHPDTIVCSDNSVADDIAGFVYIQSSPIESADPTGGYDVIIQTSPSTSGDLDWIDYYTFTTFDDSAAVEAFSTSATESDNVWSVASTSGFSAGMDVFLQDTGTLANSEWAHVAAISTNVSITGFDNVTNAKDSSDYIWEAAIPNPVFVDLSNVSRIRAVVVNQASTGVDCVFAVKLLKFTDIE